MNSDIKNSETRRIGSAVPARHMRLLGGAKRNSDFGRRKAEIPERILFTGDSEGFAVMPVLSVVKS